MSEETRDAVSPEDLQALTTRWLQCFVSAARTQESQAFTDLFHKEAILFGIHKGGCIDWPLAVQFEFDLEHARIQPVLPWSALCVVDWSMQPTVLGGDVRRGHATFFLVLQHGEHKGQLKFQAMHAHFSKL